MAIILGIDPGSRVTGYGVIDVTGARQTYVDSGCIRADTRASMADRLGEIFQGVCDVIDAFEPRETAIEKIFMARNADAALKLGQARGVAIVATVTRAVPLFEYEARKVKQAVTGTGGATKTQVQHMVQSLLKLPGKPQADAADALAIAICHVNSQHNLARMAGAKRFRRGRVVIDP